MNGQTAIANLDKEWLELIIEAKGLGLEIDTVRDFITQKELMGVKANKSSIY